MGEQISKDAEIASVLNLDFSNAVSFRPKGQPQRSCLLSHRRLFPQLPQRWCQRWSFLAVEEEYQAQNSFLFLAKTSLALQFRLSWYFD